MPVIVHNYLDTAKQATLSLKVEGLDTVGGSQQSVTVAEQGRGNRAVAAARFAGGHSEAHRLRHHRCRVRRA